MFEFLAVAYCFGQDSLDKIRAILTRHVRGVVSPFDTLKFLEELGITPRDAATLLAWRPTEKVEIPALPQKWPLYLLEQETIDDGWCPTDVKTIRGLISLNCFAAWNVHTEKTLEGWICSNELTPAFRVREVFSGRIVWEFQY